MGKIVQKVKFSPVSQNSDLNIKSYFICQNKSKDVLVSKTESWKHIYQNGTQNAAKWLTTKNENHSSFGNSETANGILMLKRVRKWS